MGRGQHQLNSVELVYFAGAGVEVDRHYIRLRITPSKLLDDAFSYYMIGQAGEGLCAHNIRCAAMYQL